MGSVIQNVCDFVLCIKLCKQFEVSCLKLNKTGLKIKKMYKFMKIHFCLQNEGMLG